MAHEPDISVVVPVHNAGHNLDALVRSIHSMALQSEIVLVDDASTDGSQDIIQRLERTDDVSALYLPENRGAGIARNIGFAKVSGRYTLFFDADDSLLPAGLYEAVRALDASSADLAMLTYRIQRHPDETEGMNRIDQEIWERYLPSSSSRVTLLKDVPRLLVHTNYPWNKILRTSHYRDVGFRFGVTQVHNDIRGHWQSLLHARLIELIHSDIGTHLVLPDGENLTNRNGSVRLSIFDALDEAYEILSERPKLRQRYAAQYWEFASQLMRWAEGRIDPTLRDEFRHRRRAQLLHIDLADYTRLRLRRDPELASRILRRSIF